MAVNRVQGIENGGSPAAEAAFSIGTAKPMPTNVRTLPR